MPPRPAKKKWSSRKIQRLPALDVSDFRTTIAPEEGERSNETLAPGRLRDSSSECT